MTTAHEGRRYWERHAANYDRSMAILGGPLARMVALAAEDVPMGSRVLEVGAGTGLVTAALAVRAGELVATDYADAMVARVEARVRAAGFANVRCARADLYALPFGEGAFDVVVAANLLHLVPDLAGALASLQRVLRPGGMLLAPTYCHAETALSRAVSRVLALTGFPGRRRLTASALNEALVCAGLTVVRAELLPGVIPIGYVATTLPRG